MRISDWSSDVCSSDLLSGSAATRTAGGADVIDGKAFAAGLIGRVSAAVERLKASPGLIRGPAVVLVGEDPASQLYVRSTATQTVAPGLAPFEHRPDAATDQATLLAKVVALNADP